MSIRLARTSERESIKCMHIQNHIELAVSNDLELDLKNKSLCCDFAELYNENLFVQGVNWVLVDEEDRIVGSISIYPDSEDDTVAWLKNYSINSSQRGKGVGLLLFNTALDYCKPHFKTVKLATLPDRMKVAGTIYEKAGFVLTKTEIEGPWLIGYMELLLK
jgi:GNAT superfamily N-acetyltransferase